jgi:two-component system, OmpR family, manganese sensing response regulator
MAKILVVEDDLETCELLAQTLERENHSVEKCMTGADGDFMLSTYEYDLVVLDWDLPVKSGLDICKSFRSRGGRTPILMLTGKNEIVDKETGLDTGADDYLTKPYAVRELLARVRSLLRRPAALLENELSAGAVVMDPTKFLVTVEGNKVDLNPSEFKLLEFLLRHPNQVFHPEVLLNKVWPSESESTVEALRSAMKRLRRKLGPSGEVIHTVLGVGYVLRST